MQVDVPIFIQRAHQNSSVKASLALGFGVFAHVLWVVLAGFWLLWSGNIRAFNFIEVLKIPLCDCILF
jgi:uncharacterized membrane protein YccF (DUF307 family)